MFWVKKHKQWPKGEGLWEEHEVMTLRLVGHQDPSFSGHTAHSTKGSLKQGTADST